jgi:hypothetical protein
MTKPPYDLSTRLFQIGTRPLDPADWLEPDAAMEAQLIEKARLWRDNRDAVFAEMPASRPAQAELLALLADYLPQRFPAHWQRHGQDMQVGPTDQTVALGADESPLLTAARLVQDDLLLLERDAEGWRLTAGALAFPSSWILAEKMRHVLDAIHEPVPGFGPGTRSAQIMARMFDAARPETPMIRWNFSLYGDDRLFHPDVSGPDMARFGQGSRPDPVFLRVERQTLRKLAETGAMAFTIRIGLHRLDTLERHPDAGRIATALIEQVTALTPEQLDYKGLTREREGVLARLAEMIAPRSGA